MHSQYSDRIYAAVMPMQQFLADLHIHSRFSRATSKKLHLELLAAWAKLKGITVLGTGDFTHPVWRNELREGLVFDEASGLYALKDESLPAKALPDLPVEWLGEAQGEAGQKKREDTAGRAFLPMRFMLQAEISSIYKRGDKVRKVHNLVFMPTLEAADALCAKLESIGNLSSDGRPILGLDSRDLLELTLEAHPEAFLVPAHIWTPWFSIFGSKSGFNSLEECFGDLAGEIFALETGLSSDPAMNRLWSALDGCRLISNSDAHSGENLGREANVFAGEVSYSGMLAALKQPETASRTRFRGTVEFFPEEGKYHMDGHRKCNVVLTPQETRALGGLCPVCGMPVTVGVFNRVMELADRQEPLYQAHDGAPGGTPGASGAGGAGSFVSLVPLCEVLGEVLGAGPKTRRVADMYAKVLERFGPELTVLRETPVSELARFFPPLGEAVRRMRSGEVNLAGGYDGEYGVVRMFSDAERDEILRGAGVKTRKKKVSAPAASLPGLTLLAQSANNDERCDRANKEPVYTTEGVMSDQMRGDANFSGVGAAAASGLEETAASGVEEATAPGPEEAAASAPLGAFSAGETPVSGAKPQSAPAPFFNEEQERAIIAGPEPVLVLAGPGTGKTHTLISRIVHLLDEGISARRILALTFTRRAASEMDERLSSALAGGPLPRTDTLHALALELWHKTNADVPVLLSEEDARRVFAEANQDIPAQVAREGWQAVNLARERMQIPAPEFVEMEQRYMTQKNAWNLADYTDLLEFWLEQISSGLFSPPWSHVLVDEVQDLSALQLNLVRSLVPATGEGFFGIGDPDQSVYGFRGAHGESLAFFRSAWPGLTVINLKHNYRSRGGILEAASAAIGEKGVCGPLTPSRREAASVHLFSAPSAEAEALWIAERAADLIGLGSHTLADAKRAAPGASLHHMEPDHSPGDIAVLVRTRALAGIYRKALAGKGVPVSEPAGDAFWADERVGIILRAAGRMLGIAVTADEDDRSVPICPDKVLANGPLGVSAYLSAFPPFDDLFWQSSAFRALLKAYDVNGGWAGLATWINLQNERELVRGKGETVQVMTLHAAKGLEFRTVFMPALEDGLIPFAGMPLLTGNAVDRQTLAAAEANVDEERRLFYVGLTRARDYIYLSHAGKRYLYGRELRLKASRFLGALPDVLLSKSALVGKATRKESQLSLL